MKRTFILVAAGIFLSLLVAGAVGSLAFFQMAKGLPNPALVLNQDLPQSTKLYDRTGQVLLYDFGATRRTVLPDNEIPKYIKEAVIAIEDQRFYQHGAFDWRGILRALFVGLVKGRFSQGGSTITQQVARNAFLTPERTVTRKIKELILAYWIEKAYSKDQVLALYLNQTYFGAGAYGVEAASEAYFGKPAKDMTLNEAAVFASLPQAPSYYAPWGPHLKELLARKNYVLDQMETLGFIDAQQKEDAQKTDLQFADQADRGKIKAFHFVTMVRDYLTQKYGEDLVNKGGLKVVTALDWDLQKAAETAVLQGALRNKDLYQGNNAALVAEDPTTGQILAFVGSRQIDSPSEPSGCAEGTGCRFEPYFNVAAQGLRQPGSALKPFVYLTAFEKGYSPQSMVFDLPTEFSTRADACPPVNINYQNTNPDCFHPQNFDGTFRGPVTFREGLAQSMNVPSVKVLYLTGMSDALKTAQDFGISTLNDPQRYGLSLVLGGGEVKLLDMVSAYATLAADGMKRPQAFVLKVDDSKGNMLEEYRDQSVEVVSPQYARLVNGILSDVNARSPLFQNSLSLTTLPDREVALKTGTTNDYKDAWTFGYTPSLVAGVWAGNNDSKPMQRSGSSILAAVPVWHAFMEQAMQLKNYPATFFTQPDPAPVSDKPMLNGSYLPSATSMGGFVLPEPHTILYYISKDNPLGLPPQNPGDDPQFMNWELPVRAWWQSRPG